MTFGIISFMLGSPKYKKYKHNNNNVLQSSFGIFYEAVWSRKNVSSIASNASTAVATIDNRQTTSPPSHFSTDHQCENSNTSASSTNSSHTAVPATQSVLASSKHILDKASREHGGSYPKTQVESIKLVVRQFPYLCILIPYWGIY